MELKHAANNTRKRKQGTLELVPINVDAEVFLDMITKSGGVLDAIHEKMPWLANKPIRFVLEAAEDAQAEYGDDEEMDADADATPAGEKEVNVMTDHLWSVDGVAVFMDQASPHTGRKNIAVMNEIAKDRGLSVSFHLQPSQSPDFNLMDLALFKGLSFAANNYAVHNKTLENILYNVIRSYELYPTDSISRAIAVQYRVYVEVLKCFGDNNYDLPHSGITKRQMHGEDAVDLRVPKSVVENAAEWILKQTKKFHESALTVREAIRGDNAKTRKAQKLVDFWKEEAKKWSSIYDKLLKK